MPTLELLPAGAPAARQAGPDAAGINPEKSSTGGEFGRLMENALTSKDQENNLQSRAGKPKPLPADGKAHPVKARGRTTTETVPAKNPAPETSAPADHAKTAPVGITAAGEAGESKTAEKIPADVLAMLTADLTDQGESQPILLTLPLTAHFIADLPNVSITANQVTDRANGAGIGTGQTVTNVGPAGMPSPVQNGNLAASLLKAAAPRSDANDHAPMIETLSQTVEQAAGQFPAQLAPPLAGRETLPTTAGAKKSPQPAGDSKALTDKTAGTVLEPLKPELSALKPAAALSTDAKTPTESIPSTAITGASIKPGLASDTPPENSLILKHPAETAGTGVATTASSMKKERNENKVAGLDVKVLPGGTNDSVRGRALPVREVVLPVQTAENRNSDFVNPWTPSGAAPSGVADTQNLVALPSLTEAQLKNMERTHDMVAMHALRLVESKSDSMQVVIKPGAGTELSLELKHRNGGVEVEAVLQRGDYQWLNQHWPELQQRLEQRGIRLAALGGENNFTAPGNQNFSQQQSRREEQAQQASAFAEFTLAMNRGGATARLAPATPGGWESWA